MRRNFLWICTSIIIMCLMIIIAISTAVENGNTGNNNGMNDSDKDGILDFEENLLKTNPNKKDTDSDGLLDEFELEIGTNPNKTDSNEDSILDGEDDIDKDKLTNLEEQKYKTNPLFDDSDNDGLSDYDEIKVYNTNPNEKDSDNDGILDFDEIKLKINPNKKDTNENGMDDGEELYKVEINSGEDSYEDIKIVLSGEVKGSYIDDIIISSIGDSHEYINKHMPGYIVAPFKVGMHSKGASAKLEMRISMADYHIQDGQRIALYEYDVESKSLTEIKSASKGLLDNEIYIDINITSEYKEYVILKGDLWDKAWEEEIIGFEMGILDNLDEGGENFSRDTDGDGIPDYFEENLRLVDGVILELDKNNPDTDGDGLLDGFEICGVDNDINKFFEAYNFEKKAFEFISRPDLKDTDGDSIFDGSGGSIINGSNNNILDIEPRKRNINDKMLLLAADLSYYKDDIDEKTRVGNIDYIFDDDSTMAVNCEISDWEVVSFNNGGAMLDNDGFGAIALKNDDKLIVSYTGSTDISDWAGNLITLVSRHPQTDNAIKFMEHTLDEFKGEINEVYISGHSLGGYLAQQTSYNLIENNLESFKTVTFNSQNFTTPKHLEGKGEAILTNSTQENIEENGIVEGFMESIIKMPPIIDVENIAFDDFSNTKDLDEYITNYVVENDPLYSRIGGGYLGKIEEPFDKGEFNGTKNISKAHKLKNFYDENLSHMVR